MHVELRPAEHTDEHAIRALDALARRGDIERIAIVHDAVASDRCLVADSNGIIGYIVTASGQFFARDFIELLVVHDDHRRRGIGRALLRAAVAGASTSRVFGSTNESNTAMRSLFGAEGWSPSGRLEGLDDDDPELVFFIDR